MPEISRFFGKMPSVMHHVTAAIPLGGHRLHLRFDDGVEGELDFASFLEFRGVFEPHMDPAFFARVRVDYGTLCWPNDTDLDPLVLYARVTGRSIEELLLAENALAP